MNNIYIFFPVLLSILILILITFKASDKNEGFNSDASLNNIFLLDQKYTAYDNLHNPYRHTYESLNFPTDGAEVVKATPVINSDHTTTVYPKPFGYDDVTITKKDALNLKDKELPQSNKHKDLEVIDGKFYRDWKWPQMPIAVEFGLNPEKYCSMYPGVYPCFRYYQRY